MLSKQVLVMDADPLERSKFGMLKKMHAAAVEHGVVMPGVVFTHPQAVCKEEALKTPLVADFLTQVEALLCLDATVRSTQPLEISLRCACSPFVESRRCYCGHARSSEQTRGLAKHQPMLV